jgi:CRISPR system Cascade subunit CasD
MHTEQQKKYLTATLYAPLVSFGGLAVGERRGSERYPTRSQLIGLLGAALGVDRADEPAQLALATGYYFAIQILAPGKPFTDYHTAQMPSRSKARYATRREELAAPAVNTVLTSRDYRSDFLAGLAVCAAGAAPYSLEQLATALAAPAYTLSLGRKSCAFGLPLAPAIAEFPNLRAALTAARPVPAAAQLLKSLQTGPGEIVADMALVPAGEPRRTEFVRDDPVSRKRWQFALREAAILNAERVGQ